jgi:hypothetical protein
MSTESLQQQVTLDDLNYFWTKTGVPCFMADRDNIQDIIEDLGFSIYYLICNLAEDSKVENKTYTNGVSKTNTSYITTFSTSIVKVVNNFIGRSVSIVQKEDLYDFSALRETAEYNLPPIPSDIVDKLDQFFRLVDAQHGTESIVILTFDPNKNDSSGWGVLIPEQSNTSVHCKYEADSIVSQKPDHVIIVGSVHSHPNMSAYASGTDHADQADFDGIHITYGWQKSVNNGATQYHIEMQMNGNNWVLKPEDVFEDFVINKDPDPQVVEWTKNVKKALPPQGGTVAHLPHTSQQPVYQTQTGSIPLGTTKGDPRYQKHPIPDKASDVPYMVIAEIDYSDIKKLECPSCDTPLFVSDVANGFCSFCDLMLCDSTMSFHEIISHAKDYMNSRKINEARDIYVWIQDQHNKDLLMLVAQAGFDYELDSLEQVEENTSSLELFYDGFSDDHLVCCDLPISIDYQCQCSKTLYFDDLRSFDEHHPYDIYDQSSDCSSCEYYYSRNCPFYLKAIVDFASNGEVFSGKIQDCEKYTKYSYTSNLEDAYDHYGY